MRYVYLMPDISGYSFKIGMADNPLVSLGQHWIAIEGDACSDGDFYYGSNKVRGIHGITSQCMFFDFSVAEHLTHKYIATSPYSFVRINYNSLLNHVGDKQENSNNQITNYINTIDCINSITNAQLPYISEDFFKSPITGGFKLDDSHREKL